LKREPGTAKEKKFERMTKRAGGPPQTTLPEAEGKKIGRARKKKKGNGVGKRRGKGGHTKEKSSPDTSQNPGEGTPTGGLSPRFSMHAVLENGGAKTQTRTSIPDRNQMQTGKQSRTTLQMVTKLGERRVLWWSLKKEEFSISLVKNR